MSGKGDNQSTSRSTDDADYTNPLRKEPAEYGEKYRDHLLRQYTMYVGTAEGVSSRRALANTFFLTASTVLVSIDGVALGGAWTNTQLFNSIFFAVFTVASMMFSLTWYSVIRSYDQLNSGKFKVIHKIEEALPATVFETEWAILGKGRTPSKYRSLSKLEARVPLIFFGVYVVLAVALAANYLVSIGWLRI